jgi:hypothetical protein
MKDPGTRKHFLYGSKNKTSLNLRKKDKLDGFNFEKKKCRVSKWSFILQIFHIKIQLIKRTLSIYPLYWLPSYFGFILINLEQNNFENFRGHFLKTCSVPAIKWKV